jgi:hypothetical protein
MRIDQVKSEIPEEQLLAEARPVPPDFPSFLSYLARLSFTDIADTILLLSSHGPSIRRLLPESCPFLPLGNTAAPAWQPRLPDMAPK